MKMSFKDMLLITTCAQIAVLFAVVFSHVYVVIYDTDFDLSIYWKLPLLIVFLSLFVFGVLLPVFRVILGFGSDGE